MPGALFGVIGECGVVLFEPLRLVNAGHERANDRSFGHEGREIRNLQAQDLESPHHPPGAAAVVTNPPVHVRVDGEHGDAEFVIKTPTAQFNCGDHSVLENGVLNEASLGTSEPVFRVPAMDDTATSGFIKGFSTSRSFGSVDEVENLEALGVGERVGTLPWRHGLAHPSGDTIEAAKQGSDSALGGDELGVDVALHRGSVGFDECGDSRGYFAQGGGNGVQLGGGAHEWLSE